MEYKDIYGEIERSRNFFYHYKMYQKDIDAVNHIVYFLTQSLCFYFCHNQQCVLQILSRFKRNYVSQEIKITELDDIGIGLYLYYGQSDDGQLYQEWQNLSQ